MFFKSKAQSLYVALALAYFPESVNDLMEDINDRMNNHLSTIESSLFGNTHSLDNDQIDFRQALVFSEAHIELAKSMLAQDVLALLQAIDKQEFCPLSLLLGYDMVNSLMASLASAVVNNSEYMLEIDNFKQEAPRWFARYVSDAVRTHAVNPSQA